METIAGIPVDEISIEALERRLYVQSALSYVGTPYHHSGRVKGPKGGVDCATLLLCAAVDAGIVPDEKLPDYSPTWQLHKDDEAYIETLKRWCVEVEWPALPGDIVLWKFARTFSHSAIVVDWPTVVHAVIKRPVKIENTDQAAWLMRDHREPRPMRLFSHWPR